MTLVKHPPFTITHPDIVPLRAADVSQLHLRQHTRLTAPDIRDLLQTSPGASFWIPETGEYIVAGNWRSRFDLHAIHGLAAIRNESRLIDAAATRAAETGIAALLLVDSEETRKPAFYIRNRFTAIDSIATFELPASRLAPRHVRTDLAFRFIDPNDLDTLRAIEAIDHAAFPWFWWNVAGEFLVYAQLFGVAIYGGYLDGELVAYVGITQYPGWGHLDRIATMPHLQGRGIGGAALEFAIRVLVEYGASRVALSTQGENQQAQRLYARRGFLRTPVHDYTVYGRILDAHRFRPHS